MSHQSELIETDIDAYLKQHEQKELLRFLTCGNVDDGKSTLIGRLLHDSKMIYEDQLEAVRSDSTRHGTTGEKVDLALLVDGLQAEREQGITIDVAYRYFSTARRKFIIADTPGHEQYTRNMATGASTCDLAIILIDARRGVMTQTRRHSNIASLLGIRHVVVAVNKMDLVEYSEEVFERIKADYLAFAETLALGDIHFVPISALEGDNVVSLSDKMSWYQGKALMEILETVEIAPVQSTQSFRLPVQYVNRPNLDFRGFCGTIASGEVHQGDLIRVLPSEKTSRVKSIVSYEGNLERAFAGQAITLTLEDEIDVSRGDMIVLADDDTVHESNHMRAHLVWLSEQSMQPGRQYGFKFASKYTTGSISNIQYRIDVNTQAHSEVDSLELNDIALVSVGLEQAVSVDPYQLNRTTGAFIIIDRLSNITVGAGMVTEVLEEQSRLATDPKTITAFELELNALIRKHFPHWQAVDLSKLLGK